ncbi:MAG: ADP-glyceromanno-heptose 6-epimerase [Bacteroidales bacterium]|nr:ADP-glyceromanno-heptose 6-epimerase [Bacteroidales bacterium]
MKYTVVTGAAGFIGSCMVNKLNNKGLTNIIVVDDFSNPLKNHNLDHKSIVGHVHRDELINWLQKHQDEVGSVYHLGARTDTTEFDVEIFNRLNLNYSKQVWGACSQYRIPLIYASSAATYGMGEHGYVDDHSIVESLRPLNPYGESKNDFDIWVLKQEKAPPFWAGMKFFNVYGPNEYHKGRMASVILHAFKQINETGGVKLFRSHRSGFADGMQLRDFVYVKDVVDVLYFMMHTKPQSGLYNLGTGKSRAFLHLAKAVFKALEIPEKIEFVDTPLDIREKYQYFTEADMTKLKTVAGYTAPFYTLEEGVYEYVTEFLVEKKYF